MTYNITQLNVQILEFPLNKIRDYIRIDISQYHTKINCNCDTENLLKFLKAVELKYELDYKLGVLNIWTNEHLFVFPTNNKGLYILNQRELWNFECFSQQFSILNSSLNLIIYKRAIWHSDYKPLYECPQEELKYIFQLLNKSYCYENYYFVNYCFENLSLENIFFSKEHNNIIYLNTGLKYVLHDSQAVFIPYAIFLGKYPYMLPSGKSISSFKDITYHITFNEPNNNLNYINFNTSEYITSLN